MKNLPFKYNARSIVVRKVTTTLTVLGVALVVAIFVLVLSLANGLKETIVSAGSPDNLLVLGRGVRGESESGLTRQMAAIIKTLPDVKIDDKGARCVSPELLINPIISNKFGSNETWTNVRGVEPIALSVHEQVNISEGRMLHAGSEEIIIGKSCARELGGLKVGERLQFGRRRWLIVGVFEAKGTKFESEIWVDLNVLMGDFNRNRLSSVSVKLADMEKSKELIPRLESDPRLLVKAFPETSYFEKQTHTATLYQAMGLAVAFILAFGALFGAMNTMYAAVAGRVSEIATLRALGFSRRAILFSFMIESVLISVMAGIIGCLLALLANGVSFTTMNVTTWSNVSFSLAATPGILVAGLLFSIVIGIAGGLLPATQAARLPITKALHEI